jgi:peptide/nickel transport system permease protein
VDRKERLAVTRLIVRRLALSVPLVFVVSVLTFVLENIAPGDAARTILGQTYSPKNYEAWRQQLGLNQPLFVQYWHWLYGVFHGSLGVSLLDGQSVTTALNQRLPVTLSLVAGTIIVSGVLGMGLGLISALRRRGLIARFVDILSLLGLALPNFWIALVLIAFLAVAHPIFPATGYVPYSQSVGGWLQSLVLPVAALSFGVLAVIAKQTRDSMLDVLDRDFIWALRARGVREPVIIFRHALRSAAIPIVTVFGLIFVGLLSGTVLVETVFGLPGLGGLAVTATAENDLPVVQGVAVYFTLMVIAVNLLVDIAYGWLNPRVRSA